MIKLSTNDKEVKRHYDSIKDFVLDRINKVLKRKYIGRNPNRIPLDLTIITYLDYIKKEVNLYKLISVSPDELNDIITTTIIDYPHFIEPNHHHNKILRNIFINHGYENQSFDKLEFIKGINVDTCPYCNRNYIYYLTRGSKIKPQIDHFFPKSIYPFLGLSYYNLIPSCQTCNGFEAKGEKDPIAENLTNQYLINNTDFKFSYRLKHINFLNGISDKESIELEFRNGLSGHLDVFKLKELYAKHSDHVIELIIKSRIEYSSEYRKYLHSYVGLTFNDDEIDRMIIGNYANEKEIHKRPLAKLYQDIGRELRLIK